MNDHGSQEDHWAHAAVVLLMVSVVTVALVAVVSLFVVTVAHHLIDVSLHRHFLIEILKLRDDLVAGEDAGWEALGIINIVASAGNSSTLAPGAAIDGIARILVGGSRASFILSDNLLLLLVWVVVSVDLFIFNLSDFIRKFVASEDAGWETLGIVDVIASASDSSALAPGAGIDGIA